jgi:hypothetical protein
MRLEESVGCPRFSFANGKQRKSRKPAPLPACVSHRARLKLANSKRSDIRKDASCAQEVVRAVGRTRQATREALKIDSAKIPKYRRPGIPYTVI